MTVNAMSTEINILSLLKLGAGCGAFIAPAFFTQRVFGCAHLSLSLKRSEAF